ncbi:histidinol-phosphate aminotransferase [mine drainage metagenome]|uniref:Histidinol-phosphate aminotransferase n=1 Tax=mine drainage metagenome TaxID=410659 RepID=T0ZUS3_9ZZZZ
MKAQIGDLLGVDPRRVFLTHGATEGNALALFHIAGSERRHRGSVGRVRAWMPEYLPLWESALAVGFRPAPSRGPAAFAVVSNPRNPEGRLWNRREAETRLAGHRAVLIDETFREFTSAPSLAETGHRGWWCTGTFTKVYGGDALRVGWVVSPPEESEAFRRWHALVADPVPPLSLAGAIACLDQRDRLLREVRDLWEWNRTVLARHRPDASALAAPVYFDRTPGIDTLRLARRAVRRSILVAPGTYFGDPGGVRICLTRRRFPTDFEAYLRFRKSEGDAPPRPSPVQTALRPSTLRRR